MSPRSPRFPAIGRVWIGLCVLAVAVAAGSVWRVRAGDQPAASVAPVLSYRVVESFPHDPRAYTQGLVYAGETLFESTGKYGASTLRQVELATGEVLRGVRLPDHFFAEGIAVWDDRLLVLTWKSRQALLYDRQTLDFREVFRYRGEGWGLTFDGHRLIMSDGTSRLRFMDPDTFRETGGVTVIDAGRKVKLLNELEYIEGSIYANVWQTDRIARIDPANGRVSAWIDLRGLWPHRERPNRDAVLNGIAYDAAGKRLLVTGKYWPRVFHIAVVDPGATGGPSP